MKKSTLFKFWFDYLFYALLLKGNKFFNPVESNHEE